ncbi:hypothetical protein D3C76_1774390 [compost metagenome]
MNRFRIGLIRRTGEQALPLSHPLPHGHDRMLVDLTDLIRKYPPVANQDRNGTLQIDLHIGLDLSGILLQQRFILIASA